MPEILLPHLDLIFTLSVFALTGTITLAGCVRLFTRTRGRPLHFVTCLGGAAALCLLILLTLGVDPGLGGIVGLAAGALAGLTWLLGAALARIRPIWVDLLVILAGLIYFTAYAEMAENAGAIPPVFSGITLPDGTAPEE